MDYRKFIERKRIRAQRYGFEPVCMNGSLLDWQARIVRWSVLRGRAAIFAGTGMGKSLMQLAWAENIVKYTGKPVLIVCPLGVRFQTVEEASKFGIGCDVRVALQQSECGHGVNVTNYDRIDKFHGGAFAGVVLDESSILKGITSATRKMLGEMFDGTQYKLCCTATPSPNDHTELGNHAEFLGVMKASDMQQRFFFHDSGDTSKWTIMPSAEKPFWSWVASWAVCIGMPSDIGGSDDGYVLPELFVHRHELESEQGDVPDGFLFSVGGVSATNVHAEKRMTVEQRIAKSVEIVKAEHGRKTLIWCDSNDEQDRLEQLLGDLCVSIRGSTKPEKKEEMERQWRLGSTPVLVTKSSIFGAGMNWQHCSKMIFVGLTYSFESYYQSIRRCWRFGQRHPVDVHLVIADSETALQSSLVRKETDFESMRNGMAEAMRERTLEEFGLDHGKVDARPTMLMPLPKRFMELQGVKG